MKALLTISIVLAILFAVWGVETLIDTFRPKTGTWLRILAALVIALAIGWLGITAATRPFDPGHARAVVALA
jgi:high-affinity Fe2+/Pb2+ permease